MRNLSKYKSLNKKVFLLAVPLILSNLTTPILGVVDTAVIGHLNDPVFLASVVAGSWMFSLFYWGFGFLKSGTTGITAQAKGSNNREEVVNSLLRALIAGIIIGVIISLCRSFLGPIASQILELSDSVSTHTTEYILIRSFSAPAVLATYALTGWLIALQKTRAVMVVTFITNGLNILLDVVLVAIFHMDVKGVAFGTLISEWVALITSAYFVLKIIKNQYQVSIRPKDIFERNAIIRILTIHSNIFIRTVALIAAHLWFVNRSSSLGDMILAANGVLLNLHMVATFFIDGFAFTCESLVGEAKGKRSLNRFREVVLITGAWALVCSLISASAFYIGGTVFINLLTSIEPIRVLANDYLIWVIIMPILTMACYHLDGIFLGTTQTSDIRNGMVISLIVFVGLTFWLIPNLQNDGLWISFCVFFIMRAITLVIRYRSVEKSILQF